jgi:hypothetical protein
MFADYKYFYKYTLSDLVNDITTGIVDEFNYISFSVKYKTHFKLGLYLSVLF